MNNRIVLSFDRSLFGLAGYKMGKETFEKQIKAKWNPGENTTIIFPNEIEILASSFIQGLCDGLIKEVGVEGIINTIDFVGGDQLKNLKELIVDNLL